MGFGKGVNLASIPNKPTCRQFQKHCLTTPLKPVQAIEALREVVIPRVAGSMVAGVPLVLRRGTF